MGLRDANEEVPEGSRDHHGLEVSSTQPDVGHVANGSHAESKVSPDPTKPADTETPMGPRCGKQQDDATGAEAGHDASEGLTLNPEDHEVLAWAVKLKAYLDIPGDVTAFNEAAQKLGEHLGNVLLLYILAQAKYPTVVRDFAVRFAAMPVPFTAFALKHPCHGGIRHAASENECTTLQREMIVYNEQRMACHMGLARVMEKLG